MPAHWGFSDMAKTAKKKPGRPRLPGSAGASAVIAIRLDDKTLGRLSKWIAKQDDKPKQSEAARRLLDLALTASGY